ncbi:MAG: phosphoribosyl-AMP cyclohydrolase [Planctomycetaceae bacterium]|nr:phosphoribosyl-AMP cyclohydrolase [Planctomycetaceae bacterium]
MSNPPQSVPDFTLSADGLLPAVAQDAETGAVLMLAYMNAESFAETMATGRAVYYSRSRGRLWRKGEESGNRQDVLQVLVDCDGDAILLKVRQQGDAACHTGRVSCFFHEVGPTGSVKIITQPIFDPAERYGKLPAKHD